MFKFQNQSSLGGTVFVSLFFIPPIKAGFTGWNGTNTNNYYYSECWVIWMMIFDLVEYDMCVCVCTGMDPKCFGVLLLVWKMIYIYIYIIYIYISRYDEPATMMLFVVLLDYSSNRWCFVCVCVVVGIVQEDCCCMASCTTDEWKNGAVVCLRFLSHQKRLFFVLPSSSVPVVPVLRR